jgi:hypothetical protein
MTNKMAGGYSYAVQGNNIKAGEDPKASYWSTFNPFSQLSTSNPVDRVPKWWNDLPFFSDPDTKYLAWKATALSLLAAGIVGGGRLLLHMGKVDNVRKNDAPGHQLKSQLNSAFEMRDPVPAATADGTALPKPEDHVYEEGNEKIASQQKQGTDWKGLAIPGSIALLAGALTYYAVDSWADQRKGEILKKRTEGKSDYLKNLIVARGRNARGTLTPEELETALNRPDFETQGEQVKQGSFDKNAVDHWTDVFWPVAGLIGAAIFATTAYGSYKYHEANNINNIKYKAYKKGLEEYAAIRSQSNPLTVGTANSNIFRRIDNNTPAVSGGKVPPVQNELLLDDRHTPVSITI